MSDLPYSDPSNPALPSPLFSDITAARGDHLRANNAAIFADLNALNARNPELVALASGSFKTAALANANTYNGRSLFTCTAAVTDTPSAAVTDTPSAAAWRIIGYWNPADSSGRFVAMADASLETWEINYSSAAWGAWTQLTDAGGNVTRDIIGDVTGDVTGDITGHSHAVVEANGAVMRWKIIEIGDWNMDADESKYVPHGLDAMKIRGCEVTIRDDANTSTYPLDGYDNSYYNSGGVIEYIGNRAVGFEHNNTIRLFRRALSTFDNSSFDSTSYNRGWITIDYVD